MLISFDSIKDAKIFRNNLNFFCNYKNKPVYGQIMDIMCVVWLETKEINSAKVMFLMGTMSIFYLLHWTTLFDCSFLIRRLVVRGDKKLTF